MKTTCKLKSLKQLNLPCSLGLITVSSRGYFALQNLLQFWLFLTDRYTIKIRTCIQIKLPCIRIPTHKQNAGTQSDLFAQKAQTMDLCRPLFLIMSLVVLWTYSSLDFYQVQTEIIVLAPPLWHPIAPQLKSPLDNHHIWGGQACSIRTEQRCHVEQCDRWTEWKRAREDPRAIWRDS